MKYRFLGRSGLRVSRVCLGTMTFGNESWGCDQETATVITRVFVEGGGNFIDTADLYAAGASETMLGVAIEDFPREELVIATKCWFPTGQDPNARGLSRKHIFDACDASLQRLGTDYIDLYQIHGPDPHTPIKETLEALDDLKRSGRIRYVGCSNLYAWQMAKAQVTAKKLQLSGFVSAQHMYNLIRRDVEREILPACEDLGIGMMCWSPLAAGMLTGKYVGQSQPDEESRLGQQSQIVLDRYWFDGALALVDMLVEEAVELSRTPAELALGWLLADQRVPSVIAGARTLVQIEESLGVGDWEIPQETRERLTASLQLNHGYPADWMVNTFKGTFNTPAEPPKHLQHLSLK